MFAEHDNISHDRLWEAVDAALIAASQAAEDRDGDAPYPADLMGHPDQPDVLTPFTRYEIEEASSFLARLGFIPPRVTK